MTGLGFLGKNASSYLVLLLSIIESNDWERFEKVALDQPAAFRSLATLISKSSEFNGMTFLHACARFNPPFSIVDRMIELCPDSPRSKDCLNRTPLHVAAGTGASVSVIKLLVTAYPEACLVQDADGRTPLHMACDSSCELFEDTGNVPCQPPSLEVVHALLSAFMDAAVLEDEEGMSALEYAIFSNADIKVVKLLQKATQKQFRKQQQESQSSRGLISISPKGRLSAPSA